ncbi:MAG: PEP-CTERM sorting domain-containing protein [Xanthobacteraceae bacterium]|nr:PEP-CTERM sorting domain-containing protein [Xanthobacteraceae bacterium]
MVLKSTRLAGLLASFAFCAVAVAPAQATPITYTISGYGSYEEPGGINTGGFFSFQFAGDTANGNYQSGLPGTLTLTPYSYPTTPGYSGALTSPTLMELTASNPIYLFAFSLPSVNLFIQLSGSALTGVSLDAPFSVTIPQADVSIPLQPIYVGGDTQHYSYIEALTSDVTFSGTVSAVPEPSTWAMMCAGFLGLGLFGLRRAGSRGPSVAAA